MTFRQTLKQLLTLSGIKSAHLAYELGYDTSYISRWVNDIKLPSTRGNDDLFFKIASVIVSGCDAISLERLSSAYGAEPAWLEEALASELKVSYNNSSLPTSRSVHPNAVFMSGSSEQIGNEYTDAILSAVGNKGSYSVDFFTTTPLELYSNRNMRFWDDILSDPRIGPQVLINAYQFVNIDDFAKNIDTYCAAICSLAKFDDRVNYTFYTLNDMSQGNSGYITSVEDNLLVWSINSGFSAANDTLICRDTNILNKFNTNIKNKLQFSSQLLIRCNSKELEESHFLYDFVMSGALRYFLSVMQPVYINDSFAKEIAMRYLPGADVDEFQMHYNSLCQSTKREVILYRTALLQYIYSGRISLFGREMQLDREDRKIHLRQLLEDIKNGNCMLKILNDVNPLLCRKDMRLSFYISRNSGFISTGAWDFPALKMSFHRVVEYFDTFFSHLWNLDEEYIISGNNVVEFIERGLNLI